MDKHLDRETVQQYSLTVQELVLTVSASDEDFGTTYSFSSGNDQELFSINHLNGQIKVNKKLDYEYIPVHTLFVMA